MKEKNHSVSFCTFHIPPTHTIFPIFPFILKGCLWRISLCLDVQKFSKDLTAPRESAGTKCARRSVLWQKTQFALWGRMGQSSRDLWLTVGGAVPMARTRKHHQTSPLCLKSSQKIKKTSPKNWRQPQIKMKTNSPKDDLIQKMKATSQPKI